ncbi:MAG: ATP-binding protein, partial [Bacteroidota bacterium]
DKAWVDGILSRAYLKKQMPDSALYYATAGLASASKDGTLEFMRDNTLALAGAYAFKNDFRNAYRYYNLYITYRDSMVNSEIKNKTAVMENNHEVEKKEVQITLLRQQKKAQQNSLIAVSAVLFLILVSAIMLLRSNRLKQRARQKIEKAYTKLKTTQAQLIQSEKMASLGELTAGIAHEIQNPLNFVNNFSDVNSELIEEMQSEMDKGNIKSAKALSDEIKENEEKIKHHGKRADRIVKGMLEHSRSGTGVKEPVDINKLAEEYLRLAYHGLRAKEKDFNVDFKTNFDPSAGKINIVAQDMGRVLLNLFSNAFYAVKDKKNQLNGTYTPAIVVNTKKMNGNVEIHVKDNGNGIPEKALDKIFRPFFTTKPTGQGTGLGLSLSYDIVRAHGGEIKVETKEGQGSDFILQLPTL